MKTLLVPRGHETVILQAFDPDFAAFATFPPQSATILILAVLDPSKSQKRAARHLIDTIKRTGTRC